ncbi:MAG TPA: lysophospholipid acyltransferase family protein [Gemmatimonadales bacterium]|nr:lysophospholipid acyltransferase family protein [Gemmatimonadales bacterium]
MIAGLRYVTSLFGYTMYHSARMVVAAARGGEENVVPGGLFDTIPRDYGRDLLRVNQVPAGVTGLAHVEGLRSCVYVANHHSWMDILAVLDLLPGRVRFVAKAGLGQVPLFGRALKVSGHVLIDRHDRSNALAGYQQAAEAIRQGISPVVFAEGTRSRTGRLQPFKKGPFVLAIAAQVPVVPVFIEGSEVILRPGSFEPKPGRITVHIGNPISTEGLTYDDRERLATEARASILGMGAIE